MSAPGRSDKEAVVVFSYRRVPCTWFLVGLLASGCGGIVGMVSGPYTADRYMPSVDEGVVLIAADGVNGDVMVIDDAGMFVGTVRQGVHTAFRVTPGRHAYYFLGSINSAGVSIEVEPGRLYPIRVSGRVRYTAQGTRTMVEARPMMATSEGFAEYVALVRSSGFYTVDRTRGDAWASQHRGSIEDGVQKVRADWIAGGEAYQAERTFGAGAGLTRDEATVFTSGGGTLP